MKAFAIASHIRAVSTLVCALIAIPCLSQVKGSRQTRPNIVIIQADDMGYDDLGMHKRTDLETPNLDRLATQSVRFTDFTVCSVCSPTRASLLTGRHFLKTGVAGVHGGHDFVNLDEKLMPQFFREAGYRTGMFGKWHSGKTAGYFPWDRGFEEAYMAKLYQYYPSQGMYNNKAVTLNSWAAKTVTDYAIDYIRRHKDQPFLAYVAYQDPHGLWRAPEEKIEKYLGKGLSRRYATLCAMVDFMDENIGRLLGEIDNLGLAGNTVVIFMSDNGPQPSDKILGKLTEEEWQQRNPSGYPGWKATNWANGVKSPLFVRWPGNYSPANVSRLVDITDILPTLLDIAGIKNPVKPKPWDGRTVKPYLEGDTGTLAERTVFYSKWFMQVGNTPGESYLPIDKEVRKTVQVEDQDLSVRNEHFKFMLNPNPKPRPELRGKYLLFDLKKDPLETRNVIDQYPEIADRMHDTLKAWYHHIVFEEKSFQAPWFQIGWKGEKETQIPAYGPSRIYGNLVNDAHSLGNWKAAGDRADYQLMVHRPGRYRIAVPIAKKSSEWGKIKISCNGVESLADFDRSLGTFYVDLPLSKGSQILSIELLDGGKLSSAPEELGSIDFNFLEK